MHQTRNSQGYSTAPDGTWVRNEPSPEFRNCEFCGCHTNAALRACCEKGRAADRAAAAVGAKE